MAGMSASSAWMPLGRFLRSVLRPMRWPQFDRFMPQKIKDAPVGSIFEMA